MCHANFLVIHTNGLHDIAIQYCGCSRTVAHHLQLLHHGLYPATQQIVRTCATFTLLDLLYKLALTRVLYLAPPFSGGLHWSPG